MEQRGLDYIDPVTLEDPNEAPPPEELRELHFNDSYLAFMKYYGNRKDDYKKTKQELPRRKSINEISKSRLPTDLAQF